MGQIVLIAAKEDSATRMIVEGGGGVKVERGTRYIFRTATTSTLVDPIEVKREGQDLLVFLKDDSTPELTLLGYFDPGMNAQLYGLDDDGQPRAYIPTDGGTISGHLTLLDGESTHIALNGPVLSDTPVITASQDYSAGFVTWPILAGAGALGVLATSLHSSGGSGGSGHSGNDTAAAPQVAITRLVSDSGTDADDIVPNGATTDTTPEIRGTGTVNATITLHDGADTLGTTVVLPDGTWSFTPTQALTLDTHSITATATNADGHSSQSTAAFVIVIIDAPIVEPLPDEAPQVAISRLVNDVYPLQGDIEPDGTTHDTHPEIIGTGTVNATITLHDGADTLGTTVVQPDGTWSFTPAQALTLDTHSITAVATNADGHSSQPTAAFVITIIDAPIVEPQPSQEVDSALLVNADSSNTSKLSLADVLVHAQDDLPWQASTAAQQNVETGDRAANAYNSSSTWLAAHLSPDLLTQQD
ncbi:Ig-like domain-containing protein [Pseudomonas nitroreducens]|uniref:Ig-like domain-containing protein n=1 Tax=Pseudomonas nitroreducens TaxID=46680 RepID=UPI003CC81AD6